MGRKCDNSICTGRKVAGDAARLLRIEEGIGWNGSELGGVDDRCVAAPGRLNIGATVDIAG